MAAPPAREIRRAICPRKSGAEGLDTAFDSLDAQRETCGVHIAGQRFDGWVETAAFQDDGRASSRSPSFSCRVIPDEFQKHAERFRGATAA